MRLRYGHISKNQGDAFVPKSNQIRVGRGAGNDIVLDNESVAPEALVFHVRKGAWELVVVGASPVEAGGARLRPGDRRPLADGMTVKLWPFSFTVDLPDAAVPGLDEERAQLDRALYAALAKIHLKLLERMELATRGSDQRDDSPEYHIELENNIDRLADDELAGKSAAELGQHAAGLCLRRELTEALTSAAASGDSPWATHGKRLRLFTANEPMEAELKAAVAKFRQLLKLEPKGDLSAQMKLLDGGYWKLWEKHGAGLHAEFKGYLAKRFLKKEIKDIVFGYGPLEDLLRMPNITEIMVVNSERIYIEKDGVIEDSGRRFVSDEVTESIIERIVSMVGKRIDKSSPLVDARLIDGSRVNAVIPPLAVSGPCLTVRKFASRKLGIDDLVKRKALTAGAREFLRAAVLARKNILVSGGTGTGKTTLLNCLSDFIPDKERIVTVEDTAELQLKKPHVVRLETKQANVEDKGAYSIQKLVINALRMRPDRIVVGECRGAEALDMLQAMNTGHDGSMTTLHANEAANVVQRLEVLVQMAAPLPPASIHRQIASAIDLVVQLQRARNGRRYVSQITEFAGLDPETGEVRTRDLYAADPDDEEPTLAPTGSLPTFMDELLSHGLLDLDVFYQ